MFAVLGVYAGSSSLVDLVLLVLIGLLGFVLRRYGLPLAPVLIAVILGPARRDQPAPRAGGQRGRRRHAVRLHPGAVPVRPADARRHLGGGQQDPRPGEGRHLTRGQNRSRGFVAARCGRPDRPPIGRPIGTTTTTERRQPPRPAPGRSPGRDGRGSPAAPDTPQPSRRPSASYTAPPETPAVASACSRFAAAAGLKNRVCGKFVANIFAAAAGVRRAGPGNRVNTENVSNAACPASPTRRPLSTANAADRPS